MRNYVDDRVEYLSLLFAVVIHRLRFGRARFDRAAAALRQADDLGLDAVAISDQILQHDAHLSVYVTSLSFAGYLVEAVCDISLTLIFYALLRPVRQDLALLAAFFGLISTALFAVAELFYFAGPVILEGAHSLKGFSPDQRDGLVMLSLKLYGYGGGIFMVFYGLACLLRGYLIFRSGFLPRVLGVLLALAGLGFVTRNFLLVLAPAYASDFFLLPMFLAGLALAGWLLVKGVDVATWEAKAAASK